MDDKFDGAILDELRWQDNLLQSAICLRGMEYKRGRGKRKKKRAANREISLRHACLFTLIANL